MLLGEEVEEAGGGEEEGGEGGSNFVDTFLMHE